MASTRTWASQSAQRTITLIVPSQMTDIYALHQAVWDHVDKIHQRENAGRVPGPDTQFLYRRDGARVTVRGNCFKTAGIPTPIPPLQASTPKSFKLCIAPFRNLRQQDMNYRSVNEAIQRAFENAGLVLIDHQCEQMGIATGVKVKAGQFIELPYFNITGNVACPDRDHWDNFWTNGIGRGRRFGFGMPISP